MVIFMCHPKVGNLNDKSTYFKTQENFTFVFEGNCPKLRIFALLVFFFGCALLDIFKVCQFSQTDKCLPSVLCVYMEN